MVFKSFWSNFFGSEGNNEVCKGWYHKTSSIFVCLLLPVAGLTFLWIKKELFTRILIHIDGICLPIIYPTFSRSRCVLDWARGRLPPQWSSHLETLAGGLADFWRDGSLLCTLINSALPGACANPYRHWKKRPIHGQNLAYKYLGIIPVFTQSDFASHLSPSLEAKLINHMYLIRKAIYTMEKERLINNLISPKFVARGMGLYTADQYKKTEFYIYSKYDNVSFFNIEVIILGPYSSYCRTTVLEYLIKQSKIKNDGKNQPGSISMEIEMDKERIKVAYMTKNCGIHEINLSCNRESIMGSPFYVNVVKCPTKNVKTSAVQTVENEEAAATEKSQDVFKNNNLPFETTNSSTNKHTRNHISDSQTLEISKYLKDLSNSRERKVNINANLLTSRDKIWANCPDYFTRENYLYFQKLVDSSFRKICRVTRAHPKHSQKKFPQFSSASPICSDHIVPESRRKVTADDKRKVFSLNKSISVDDTFKNSSFSNNENKEDFKIVSDCNHKPLIVGELLYNSKDQKRVTNEKSVKRLQGDVKKRSLQKLIQEKALFWESAFKKATALPNQSIYENNNSLANQNLEKSANSTNKLKHVDSLCLLRKRPLIKSLSDLRKSEIKKIQSYRSIDENLVSCSKISIEDRMKLYLENVRQLNGELVDELVTVNKVPGIRENLRKPRTKRCEKNLSHKNHNPRTISKQFLNKTFPYSKSSKRVQLLSQNFSHINKSIIGNGLKLQNRYCSNRKVKNNALRCNNYYENRLYNTYCVTKIRKSSINMSDVLY